MKRIPHLVSAVIAASALLAAAHADEVTDWNEVLFRSNLVVGTNPLLTTRVGAIVAASVFDAVNGIERRYEPIHVPPAGPGGASVRAAAVEAAYVNMVRLLGAVTGQTAQTGALDARHRIAVEVLRSRETTSAVDQGLAWGKTVADAIWAWRGTDGLSDVLPPYTGGTGIGQWRPTGPGLLPGFGQQFADMVPWVIDAPAAFHPPGPPALDSARYLADFNETKSFGSATSTLRTRDQTVFSIFWNGSTAAALWNAVAVDLLGRGDGDDDHDRAGVHGRRAGSALLQHARFLAQLNLAMADAAIGCWEAKYSYSFWRPITAIQNDDSVAATAQDAAWTPLLVTPNHPDYPSGHSCLSGAAGVILADQFGERTRFTVANDALLGVSRSFRSFSEALEEVKNARIYSGIHFRSACDDGQALGRGVAGFILEEGMQPAQ
jgi:hypothetical protein